MSALAEVWKQKERAETKRFTTLLSCITGQQIDPPEDDSERENELRQAAERLDAQRKNG